MEDSSGSAEQFSWEMKGAFVRPLMTCTHCGREATSTADGPDGPVPICDDCLTERGATETRLGQSEVAAALIHLRTDVIASYHETRRDIDRIHTRIDDVRSELKALTQEVHDLAAIVASRPDPVPGTGVVGLTWGGAFLAVLIGGLVVRYCF